MDSKEENKESIKPFIVSLAVATLLLGGGYAGWTFFIQKKDAQVPLSSAPPLTGQQKNGKLSTEQTEKDRAQKQAEDSEVPVVPPAQEEIQQDENTPSEPAVKLYPMTVNTTAVSVELAESREQQEKGLGGRTGLPEGRGLLYLLAKPDFYTFWMKNMKFPIDIIWVDKNQKIIDITHNLTPDSYPRIFQPVKPAQIILEVNAGFAKKNGINIGDPVTVPKIQK